MGIVGSYIVYSYWIKNKSWGVTIQLHLEYLIIVVPLVQSSITSIMHKSFF